MNTAMISGSVVSVLESWSLGQTVYGQVGLFGDTWHISDGRFEAALFDR